MNNQMKHSPWSSLSRFIASTPSRPLIITVILIILISLFLLVPAISHPKQSIPVSPSLLPGQQIWKNGVSSYLFGTNDTQEWVANNVETDPTLQHALNDAHFTLMRTFFFDKSLLDSQPTTDAEIEQRLKTVENSGMNCLGVLESVYDPAFVKHVVAYAGNRCNLYEFGNEPDNSSQLNIQEYIQEWNNLVPQLRKINPHAKFIGPAVANYRLVQIFLDNVRASGVLPDAISFHWYPCVGSDTASSCLAKTSTFEQVAVQVKKWVQSILGQNLPVGITEWNYNADNPPAAYGQDPKFITQFSISALDSMIRSGLDFANQFDAASDAGSGGLDLFDLTTGQPRPQYYAIKDLIDRYMPASLLSPTTIAPAFRSPQFTSTGKS